MKVVRILYRFAANSLQQTLANIPVFVIFLVAKILRYGLFLIFLFLLVRGVAQIGGYTTQQMLMFYLVFNLIDTTAQLLFREVYRFRPLVVSGEFDLVLTKPLHPLIRSLLGGPDFIDSGMLLILLVVMGYFIFFVIHPQFTSLLLFGLLSINALAIAAAFHIFVLGIGVITLSVDHLIMIYRDVTSLVRIPADLYIEPLRTLITFVIPVGIMFSFPAKVLFGLLSWQLILVSLVFGIVGLILSIKFWNYSLKHYQSASS